MVYVTIPFPNLTNKNDGCMLGVSSVLFQKLLTIIFLSLLGLTFATKANAATFEEDVVSLINSERSKQGLSSLNYSDKLFQASLKHNNTMFDCSKTYSVNSCFTHQVALAGEESLLTRIQKTGYNPQSVAENIAWGYQTPASVVGGWMGSSGHRANILGSYRDIGCDYLDALNGNYQGKYWTCDFGKSFNTTSPTATLTPTRSVIPTPTIIPTKAITPTPTRTPTPSISMGTTITPTPTQSSSNPVSGSREWWCKYAPGSYFCPNP